jgi:molybdopterin-containing oxidoreductase family membrane subunit
MTQDASPVASERTWSWGRYGPFPRAPWDRQLWAVWIVMMALGLVGVVQRVVQGHMPAGYGSYVPWGLWIAIYFHAVGIATGSFLVGALGYLFDWRGLGSPAMLRTVIVLAIAAMFPAFLAVLFDLGHMERAASIVTSPNFASMMAFNAWMYQAFVLVGIVCWFLSFPRKSEWLKPLLVLAVLLAVIIPSQSGAFIGVVHAKPFWHSPLFPIVFLASAVTSGAATLLAVRAALGPEAFRWAVADARREHDDAIDRLRIVVIAGLFVYAALEWAELSVNLWSPAHADESIDLILYGPYWWVFWIVHLALGMVLPLLLLMFSRSRRVWAIASVLVAVTFLAARLNVLIPGQAVPELRGLESAFSHPRLTYVYDATPMEYLVGCFFVAVGMAVYFIQRRVGAVIAFHLARERSERGE